MEFAGIPKKRNLLIKPVRADQDRVEIMFVPFPSSRVLLILLGIHRCGPLVQHPLHARSTDVHVLLYMVA